jgi:dTMP kinase
MNAESESHNHPGVLVTIEGIDGAGKGTVLRALRDQFPEAVFTTEPNETNRIGDVTRWALQSDDISGLAMFHLFLADHHQHVKEIVEPALAEGKIVISDRYIDSRFAYQPISLQDAIPGTENDVRAWVHAVQETPKSIVVPDSTLLLDISVEESFLRKKQDTKERFEKVDFLTETRENYLRLAEEYGPRYTVIDGERSPETVARECINAVRATCEQNGLVS